MGSSKIMIKKNVLTLCRTGILGAVALVLSALESMIPPLPFALPGMKLGLSNLAVMFSLELCSLPCALAIVVIKALFALFTRGVIAFFMSFCGGLLATLGMFFLVRFKKASFGCLGIGVLGAFLHNMGQFAVAYILLTDVVSAYLPVLCLSSLLTGAVTGLVYYVVMPQIKRIPLMKTP